jgi:O-acetyl-ADP-ribose deacetylase (regulator of RNase III)
MEQKQRLIYLIRFLLSENPQHSNVKIPETEVEQQRLLRSLFNIRNPKSVDNNFIEIQNAYLQEEIRNKGITDADNLPSVPSYPGISIWKGDITTLKVGAIVNAANNGMLGCFVPCHACIDNAIHTFAGVQLRMDCDVIMKKQGYPELTGQAKITTAYNLPSNYILHTVGPIIMDRFTQNDCDLLASCYRSCLELATENGVKSIAFCCISTGEFCFPNERAAEIAIKTVNTFMLEKQSEIKVVYNVFKETDYEIYRRLLGGNI